MPRKRRSSSWRNPVAIFLEGLRTERGMSYRAMAELAGCAASTVHGWATGAMPCESIVHLKRLCESVGVPLSVALTGSPEIGSGPLEIRVIRFVRPDSQGGAGSDSRSSVGVEVTDLSK